MEWVQDWLDPAYYRLGMTDDPTGPATGRVKIEKGAGGGAIRSWLGRRIAATRIREYADHHIGFRIVSR